MQGKYTLVDISFKGTGATAVVAVPEHVAKQGSPAQAVAEHIAEFGHRLPAGVTMRLIGECSLKMQTGLDLPMWFIVWDDAGLFD